MIEQLQLWQNLSYRYRGWYRPSGGRRWKAVCVGDTSRECSERLHRYAAGQGLISVDTLVLPAAEDANR